MIVCGRCARKVETVRQLEAHLVEQHLMGGAQAKKESALMGNGQPAVKVARAPMAPPELPAPEPNPMPHVHDCPACGASIPCDYAGVAILEQQAHRLKILAGMWKARLGGATIGRPRKNTFNVEAARQLVAEGMTYEAVAQALGASSPSAVKSALKRAEARPR